MCFSNQGGFFRRGAKGYAQGVYQTLGALEVRGVGPPTRYFLPSNLFDKSFKMIDHSSDYSASLQPGKLIKFSVSHP